MIDGSKEQPEPARADSPSAVRATGTFRKKRLEGTPSIPHGTRRLPTEAVVFWNSMPCGAACLLILFYHFKPHLFPGGWIAVDLFFVLSGYLITSIILRHSREPNFLVQFYIRRGLRILPVYYLTVLFVVVVSPILPRVFEFAALPSVLTYTQNFSLYWSASTLEFTPYLSHGWSLAVEEQFYLIWPILICVVGRRGVLPMALALLGASIAARATGFHWWLLLARGDGLAFGAILAAIRTEQGMAWRFDPRLPLGCGTLAALAYLIWVIASGGMPHVGMPRWPALTVLAANVLCLGIVGLVLSYQGHPTLKVLRRPGLVWLGTLSYGIYMYHYILILLSDDLAHYFGMNGRPFWREALTAGAIISLAALSWRYLESPLLRLKDRFDYSARTHDGIKHANVAGRVSSLVLRRTCDERDARTARRRGFGRRVRLLLQRHIPPGQRRKQDPPGTQSGRRKSVGWWMSAVAGILGLVIAGGIWRACQDDSVEPDAVERVDGISLVDTSGHYRSLAGGPDAKAVVFLFLGLECPVSNAYVPEMCRLAETYGARGVVFRGIHSGASVSAEAAARHKAEHGLTFPVFLDPDQELAERAGVDETPEAVVLDAQGVVVYRGRIDDRYSGEGRRRKSARTFDLQNALEDVLAGRNVAVSLTEPFGCPLPKVREGASPGQITYSEHIAPVLAKRCVGCHQPGEVGPFSLLTYEDAARRADFLRDVTASRRMPPWKPRHGFGEFLDESRLARRELAMIAAWAEAGAPEGEPAKLPSQVASSSSGWHLGEPDLIIPMTESFTVPASEDIYRAFVLPIPLEQAKGIAAIEFRPGNRKVVHHARLYLDATSQSRARDLADPAPGFASVGGSDIPRPTIAAWNPGVRPRNFPEGVGHVVKPGSDLVVLIHYHGLGKIEVDQSSVGLYFAETPVTRSMRSIPMSTAKIDIPPGDSRHRISLRTTLPADAHAYSVLPHGHYLMREIKLWATLPDGSTRRLLWIDDWDINWQGIYHFAEPVPLPKGTQIHVIATYDNSEGNHANPNHPPKRVKYGPASTDEMLGCHIQILPDRPEDDRVIKKKRRFAL